MTNKPNIFNNPLQNALTRMVSNKPAHVAPGIAESFIGDDGEIWYALCNGNTQSQVSYDGMWHPHRTEVKPFNYQGENPNKHRI